MPLYEFECTKCKHRFEQVQSINSDVPDICPECDQLGSIERLISRTSFRLNGDGWYRDGYSSKKPS